MPFIDCASDDCVYNYKRAGKDLCRKKRITLRRLVVSEFFVCLDKTIKEDDKKVGDKYELV